MKLKAMMYAIQCGKSRENLVRAEGARRVKQAEVMFKHRRMMKTLEFPFRYGTSGKLSTTSFQGNKNVLDGVDFSELEARLKEFNKGYAVGKGGL